MDKFNSIHRFSLCHYHANSWRAAGFFIPYPDFLPSIWAVFPFLFFLFKFCFALIHMEMWHRSLLEKKKLFHACQLEDIDAFIYCSVKRTILPFFITSYPQSACVYAPCTAETQTKIPFEAPFDAIFAKFCVPCKMSEICSWTSRHSIIVLTCIGVK